MLLRLDLSVAQSNRLRVIALLGLAGALVGCYPINSESRVTGLYELTAGEAKIALDIRRDHTFTETIKDAGIGDKKRTGKWKWTGALDMDSLWIPPNFAPGYIIQADADSGPGKFKYTEPGHWSLGPEWHFGRVILPIFPDDDVEFRMIEHH